MPCRRLWCGLYYIFSIKFFRRATALHTKIFHDNPEILLLWLLYAFPRLTTRYRLVGNYRIETNTMALLIRAALSNFLPKSAISKANTLL